MDKLKRVIGRLIEAEFETRLARDAKAELAELIDKLESIEMLLKGLIGGKEDDATNTEKPDPAKTKRRASRTRQDKAD